MTSWRIWTMSDGMSDWAREEKIGRPSYGPIAGPGSCFPPPNWHDLKKSPDANVEALRDLLLSRSVVGLKKYGKPTSESDEDLRYWLQHALEEVLDQAVYLQAAIAKLDKEPKRESLAEELRRLAAGIDAKKGIE
jgi:hypothetical protein